MNAQFLYDKLEPLTRAGRGRQVYYNKELDIDAQIVPLLTDLNIPIDITKDLLEDLRRVNELSEDKRSLSCTNSTYNVYNNAIKCQFENCFWCNRKVGFGCGVWDHHGDKLNNVANFQGYHLAIIRREISKCCLSCIKCNKQKEKMERRKGRKFTEKDCGVNTRGDWSAPRLLH